MYVGLISGPSSMAMGGVLASSSLPLTMHEPEPCWKHVAIMHTLVSMHLQPTCVELFVCGHSWVCASSILYVCACVMLYLCALSGTENCRQFPSSLQVRLLQGYRYVAEGLQGCTVMMAQRLQSVTLADWIANCAVTLCSPIDITEYWYD